MKILAAAVVGIVNGFVVVVWDGPSWAAIATALIVFSVNMGSIKE